MSDSSNLVTTVETLDTSPFKKMIMTIGELPTSFIDSMTYYEMLAWFCDYLQNTVIPTVNNNAEVSNELQEKYIVLHDYVEHYFDNLDVQQEINNKIDKMVNDGSFQTILDTYVAPSINALNTKIDNNVATLDQKITGLASGSPLVASSTAGMTDTSRVYVNTTDGKWYYYDGDSWEIGGTYQSTGIGEDTVGISSLDNNLEKAIFKTGNVTTCAWFYYNYAPSTRRYTNKLFFKKGSTITPSAEFLAKYNWWICRVNSPSYMTNITNTPDMESYTFATDMECAIRVDPKEGFWGDENNPYGTEFTTEDLDFTYYLPIINNNKNLLLDLDANQLANNFSGCTFDSGVKQYFTSGTRLAIPKIYKSNYPILLKIKSGYQLSLQFWSGDTMTADNYISQTNWITDSEEYLVPANTYFSFCFRKSDNSSFADATDLTIFVNFTSYPNYKYLNDKIDEAIAHQDSGDYAYYGQDLNMRRKRTFNVEKLMDTIVVTSSSQSFEVYGDYIIQFYGNGVTQILNHSTQEEVGRITSLYGLLGHCGSCQFTPNFYDAGDLLPIINISSQTYPATVAQTRIQSASSAGGSVLKTYKLSTDDGYWSVQCCDFDRKIMYSIGYKANSYSSSANNALIFSAYDMTQETLNGDGTYSLTLIERYEMPWKYCIQSAQFLNGNIFLVSSLESSVQHSKILVYNPDQKKYVSTFEDLPTELAEDEVEAIAFMANGNYYKIIAGTRSLYDLIEFV